MLAPDSSELGVCVEPGVCTGVGPGVGPGVGCFSSAICRWSTKSSPTLVRSSADSSLQSFACCCSRSISRTFFSSLRSRCESFGRESALLLAACHSPKSSSSIGLPVAASSCIEPRVCLRGSFGGGGGIRLAVDDGESLSVGRFVPDEGPGPELDGDAGRAIGVDTASFVI